MKRIIIILILIFFISCENIQERQLYFEYIEIYNGTIQLEENAIELIFLDFDKKINDLLFGFPQRYIIWQERAKIAKNKSDSLLNTIETLKLKIWKPDGTNNFNKDEIQNSRFKIKESEIMILKSDISKYKNYIISNLNNEEQEDRNKLEINLINRILNIEKIFNLNGLNGNTCNSLELYAILTKIQSDIKITENQLISYYHLTSDSSSRYRFWNSEVIVEAFESEILLGNKYKANIFFSHADTTRNLPELYIENEKIPLTNGKFLYKKYCNISEIGEVKFIGYFYDYNRNIKDSVKIPFKVEYEIIQNENSK